MTSAWSRVENESQSHALQQALKPSEENSSGQSTALPAKAPPPKDGEKAAEKRVPLGEVVGGPSFFNRLANNAAYWCRAVAQPSHFLTLVRKFFLDKVVKFHRTICPT